MKSNILIAAALASTMTLSAQNLMNLTLTNGKVESFKTNEIESVEIEENTVTVNPITGSATIYKGQVAGMSFVRNTEGRVVITEAEGWFETTYVKWLPLAGASNYYVYVKAEGASNWEKLDYQLVRNYGTYGRADMVGLKAGRYQMKVVPVVNGAAKEELASETGILNVTAHNRDGFAHFNYSQGVGAYKNDGTLKEGAKVIYVTANTAKTISTDVKVSNKGAETFTGLQAIITAYQKGLDKTPIAFRIIGRLAAADLDAMGSSAEGLQIKGKAAYSELNITIEGIGDDATVHGFGFLVRSSSSVEMRNFAIMNCMDDCVSLDTSNSRIWIHNLDLFYGSAGGAADQAKGDGTIDLKGNSQYITISYNHLFDCGKASLCGMKSETGPNWITYHHNWFDHSDSRMPRIRTMSVHVYNNYYDGVSKYGVGATTGADAFVEANYFRDCKYPILTSMQGSDMFGESATKGTKGTFSGEAGGSIKAFNNVMRGWYFYRPWSESNQTEFDCYEVKTRDEKVPSTVKALSGGDTYSNWDTDNSKMYSYTVDDPNAVPALVKGKLGAGRINHGDFKWTFNNNAEDKDYSVSAELKSAVMAYDSYLVGNFEGDTKIGNGGVGSKNPGGASSEGDEFPFGDGNFAPGQGGSITPPTPSGEEGEVFIGATDGSYLRFDEAASATIQQLIDNGTIVLGSPSGATAESRFNPTFANIDWTNLTGALTVVKNGGWVIFKCPSISVFKTELLRTGSYNYVVEKSTDKGATWTQVLSVSKGIKGLKTEDLSSKLASDGEVWVRYTNTATGDTNFLGLVIKLAK